MKLNSALCIGIMLISNLACATRGAANQSPEWVLLGQREVTDRLDRDRITVTSRRGDFRRIKITVHRQAVDFHRVVVHFGNGTKQEIEMRRTIRAGDETRSIDLRGDDRVIRSVEFWYDANSVRGRKAVVRLHARR